jgi:tricorn protease interacting factor F2/3
LKTPKIADLFVNPKHTGYYSVLYDTRTYGMLARRFHSIDEFDKGGLMNDLYLFLQAGEVDPQLYYRFIALCNASKDHLVVQTVTDQLANICAIVGDVKAVHDFCSRFWASQIQRLGLSSREGEDDKTKDDRGTVATRIAALDDHIAEKLAPRYENYDKVEPEMKEAVAVAYACAGGERAFDSFMKKARQEDDEVERARIYRALTCSRDVEHVRQALDLVISGEVSRSDSGYALNYASSNPLARDTLWSWIKSRHQKLWKLYGGSQQYFLYLDAIIPRCGVGHEKDAREFLLNNIKEHGGITFQRTLEQLEINCRLRKVLSSIP